MQYKFKNNKIMKKLVFMLGAVLTFGIAGAQTEPATVTQESKSTSVTTQEKVKTQKEAGTTRANARTATTAQPAGKDAAQQDKAVTADHVKATPAPKNVTDTVAVRKTKAHKTKKS
jgi:hypothetical protein